MKINEIQFQIPPNTIQPHKQNEARSTVAEQFLDIKRTFPEGWLTSDWHLEGKQSRVPSRFYLSPEASLEGDAGAQEVELQQCPL
ncbi:hypothetical protein Ccrd_005452 [Cynara cardunculus var. scolymus]|uniref:Uncharacterized protein n=1 Tax=Cynara cardunculus var. scolymus TaxID=59895 RepID=A0A124SC28_CYNCS|nr:hypothetical protein Ccrd_005452 [Cynara cardunculus var. scolymus]